MSKPTGRAWEVPALAAWLAFLLLAGCRGSVASTALVAGATARPTLVTPAPTVVLSATAEVATTAQVAPAASSPAQPTMAPSATLAAGATATPLPDNINPLTGEAVADPALLDHRPLAIKIVNEPACSRPQFGLNRAAVVFEHYVEAWGTRFTAVFYGQPARKIGAVRSARLIDLELPTIFDAILVTSGASAGVKQRLDASDFAERIIGSQWQAPCPPLCRVPVESVGCADLEHTLFTDQRTLQGLAAARGLDRRPALSGWAFGDLPATAGEPAQRVQIRYLNSPVTWFYDPAKGAYLRSQDGVRQADAETRLRLTAANVIALFAHHVYSDIRESSNFYSLEIQLWGQGPALYFRDGQAYWGAWRRARREGLFELLDASGRTYALKPGRTWFELVALDSPVQALSGEVSIDPAVLPPSLPPAP